MLYNYVMISGTHQHDGVEEEAHAELAEEDEIRKQTPGSKSGG
jgi:hypothetical protein